MVWLRRTRNIVLATLAGLVVVVLVFVLLLTQTDWGRQRVLTFGLNQLIKRVHGEVKIARVQGNLLLGARLTEVVVNDTAGRPFLRADTVELRYSMRSFVRKHLTFNDVRIVNGVIILDQPPGEEWNFKRIFPGSRTPRRGPGFGSWVAINNMTVKNVDVTVRSAWKPPESLTGAARERAIANALENDRRLIVPVRNGFQTVSHFYDVNSRLPYLRLADPDSANRLIRIGSLNMTAQPFRPPPAIVQNMSATVVITKDSVLVNETRIRLPSTRASGSGAYALNGRGGRVQLTMPEASFADARFIQPDLPEGHGSLRLAMSRREGRTHLIGSQMDLRTDGATIRGLADITFGAGQATLFGPSDVTYANVHTRLIKRYVANWPLKKPATLSGRMRLSGTPENLAVDGTTNIAEANGPTSRIVAEGHIGSSHGELTARRLRLRFEPLHMSLARQVTNLPYSGVITGTTTLTGSPKSGFDVVADLVHDSRETGRSHVTANGRVTVEGGFAADRLKLGLQPLQVAVLRPFITRLPIDGVLTGEATVSGSAKRERIASTVDVEHRGSTGTSRFVGRANASWRNGGSVDVDVRVPTLSLATIGRFAPAAGLRGSASGDIVARGALSNLHADLDLAIAGDNGEIQANGTFDLKALAKSYDFTSTFTRFNAGAVIARAPQTSLTGTLLAKGSGTDPATATASISASLFGSRAVNSPLVDTLDFKATLGNGLAVIERGHVRLASARADVAGSFGMVEGRSGTLRYDVAVDTLSDFVANTRRNGTVVKVRPLAQARIVERARQDSTHAAQRTQVQRMAVGYPPPPRLKADTLPVTRDTVAGSLHARGTLTGNIKRFDAQGTLVAHNFSYGTNYVAAADATYNIRDFRTPQPTIHVEAAGDSVHVDGFAFDSAHVKLDYAGVRNAGRGTLDLAAFQDSLRDYRVRSDFNLSLEAKRLAIQTLSLRFDTVTWKAPHPATIAWGKPGTTVGNLELRSNTGGSLRVDGVLPTNGVADLRIDIEHLQLGDITAMMQDTGGLRGLFNMHAQVRGTSRSPTIAGNVRLVESSYRGTALPDARATLTYANQEFTTHVEFFRTTTRLAVADARLPINLALEDVYGPRFNRNAPIQVDVRADSLPLEALPSFTTVVSDVRGRVRGNATVRGSVNNPIIDGIANLDLGSMRLVPSGVLYNNIVGTIRLRGDTAYVDSIVAHSGGTVRTTGKLTFETLTAPGFDLKMVASDAYLLDNKRGTIRADVDVTIKGPYTGVVVAGNIDVRGGVLYAPETRNQRVTNLDDPLLRARLDTVGLGFAVLPQPNPLMRNLKVDVTVRIQPDTWARNSQLNVEIFTPREAEPLRIHMDNKHQVLTLTGAINTDHGEYTVAGRSLQLSTGSATFLGGPTVDPLIELTARYTVQRKGLEALVVEVHVDGNLSKPRVTLQSNAQPPLPQSELLAYLAFGQPSSSLLNTQSSVFGIGNGGITGLPALAQQQLASIALGATVDQLTADIEKRGTRSGLDVFRVHAGELPAEAVFEGYFTNIIRGTEVEAGKYLTDRLYVEARGRTSTYPGVSLQYRNPFGLTLRSTWEPRYLPVTPSLSAARNADQVRSFGLFMLYSRRF